MALSGRHEHKVWRDEVGGPFLEVILIFSSLKYLYGPLSTRLVNRLSVRYLLGTFNFISSDASGLLHTFTVILFFIPLIRH